MFKEEDKKDREVRCTVDPVPERMHVMRGELKKHSVRNSTFHFYRMF